MTTSIKELADAVTAELNDSAFSQAFTASREYAPTIKAEDLADLRVIVAPGGIETERLSRTTVAVRYKIDIGILKRVDSDVAEIDNLIELANEIRLFFDNPPKTLERLQTARLSGAATIEPLYDPDQLRQNRVFASVVRLTYFLG